MTTSLTIHYLTAPLQQWSQRRKYWFNIYLSWRFVLSIIINYIKYFTFGIDLDIRKIAKIIYLPLFLYNFNGNFSFELLLSYFMTNILYFIILYSKTCSIKYSF